MWPTIPVTWTDYWDSPRDVAGQRVLNWDDGHPLSGGM
jgi:hypothetical protein